MVPIAAVIGGRFHLLWPLPNLNAEAIKLSPGCGLRLAILQWHVDPERNDFESKSTIKKAGPFLTLPYPFNF